MSEIFDQAILDKYNTPVPRYTSYPTALSFSSQFEEQAYNDAVKSALSINGKQELSIYIHIPFCHSLCYYCGCNKIVTRHQHKAIEYIEYLTKEIHQRAKDFAAYKVSQIHFGGGTPSFLTAAQLKAIVHAITSSFYHVDEIDMSIEIDPRRIDVSYVDELACIGFNRLSIGVQDVNKEVQDKINRVQSTSFIHDIVKRAKRHGFRSVNLDLIYGLPAQTLDGFAKTLDEVIAINPDRISLFSYAHLPAQFASQRKIKDEWLPSAAEKIALLQISVEYLNRAGYVFIGMDHFAKPEDELCKALKKGALHRNFQGYTSKQYTSLLGLGVSSISSINSVYAQNSKDLKDYYERINTNQSFITKGVALSKDDELRRDVIQTLMCNFVLDKETIEAAHNINFDEYFAWELSQLNEFEEQQLLTHSNRYLRVETKGRMIVRHICMAFDTQQSTAVYQNRFSKAI